MAGLPFTLPNRQNVDTERTHRGRSWFTEKTTIYTRVTDARTVGKALTWDVVQSTNMHYQFQTADGSTCLRSNGEGNNVTAAACEEDAAEVPFSFSLIYFIPPALYVAHSADRPRPLWQYDIVCQCLSCGTISEGQLFATGCWVKSIAFEGQCIARVNKVLTNESCEDVSKNQALIKDDPHGKGVVIRQV
ncbi:hypothetical protein JCM11641_003110 [Rhodosporidiobolus odoratus]